MSIVTTTITYPTLLQGFEPHEVHEAFKLFDYYWDCCIIGNAIQTLLRKTAYIAFMISTELIKFGLVLFLAYILGKGIFELWAGVGDEEPKPPNGDPFRMDVIKVEDRINYPYVVDLPTKFSGDIPQQQQRASNSQAARSSAMADADTTAAEKRRSSDRTRRSSGMAANNAAAAAEQRRSSARQSSPIDLDETLAADYPLNNQQQQRHSAPPQIKTEIVSSHSSTSSH